MPDFREMPVLDGLVGMGVGEVRSENESGSLQWYHMSFIASQINGHWSVHEGCENSLILAIAFRVYKGLKSTVKPNIDWKNWRHILIN